MKRNKKLLIVLVTIFVIVGGASIIFRLFRDYPIKYILSKIEWNNSISLLFVFIGVILIPLQINMIINRYRTSFFQKWIFSFIMSLYILSCHQELLKPFESFFNIPTISWTWHYFFEQSRINGKWYSLIFSIKLVDVISVSLLFPIYSLTLCVYNIIKSCIRSILAFTMILFPNIMSLKKFFIVKKYYLKYRSTVKRLFTTKRKIIEYINEKYEYNLEILGSNSLEENSLFFEEDTSIESSSDKYSHISKILVSKLLKQKFKNSFSIGIIGPWGNGKTSFISHFLEDYKKEADKNTIEVVNFYPAHNQGSSQILNEFLGLLAFHLRKYDGRLSQTILSYAAKLLEVGMNGTKSFQGLLKSDNLFFQNKTSYKLYEDLRDIFCELDIQILIIIDDVDRLNNEEIIELLRIIRNTVNFPNVIFVVAFDKDYVIKTIDKPIEYLDKYFQYELYIPPNRKEDLIKAFSQQVLSKFSLNTRLEKAMQESVLSQTMLVRFVFNYRDVKVLCNNFCVNIELLSEDVDYIDLLHFTLMNRNYPTEVRYIYDNFSSIFDTEKSYLKGSQRYNKIILRKKDNDKECPENIISQSDIEDKRKDLFCEIFKYIFIGKEIPKDPFDDKNFDLGSCMLFSSAISKELSILNIEKTHLFFELVLRNDDISNVEFETKIQLNIFQDYIDKLIKSTYKKEEKKKQIYNKLLSIDKSIYNRQIIKNIIKVCNFIGDVSLIHVLKPLIYDQEPVLKKIFNNSVEDYSNYFVDELWNNKKFDIEFRIRTLLGLLDAVYPFKDAYPDKYSKDKSIIYLGLDDVKLKENLISLTKTFIKRDNMFDINSLVFISKIFDCELGVEDKDVGFSKCICSERHIFEFYLQSVILGYEPGFSYSSAIFKVFNDKESFKRNTLKWSEELPQINEFYHLLELHDIRASNSNFNNFTPFYFTDERDKESNNPIQSIYVKKKKEFHMDDVSDITHPDFNIEVSKVNESIYIIEGQHSYYELIKKLIPETGVHGYVDYLRDHNNEFEILSIQCPQGIDKKLYSLVGNYKT
ncbi:MAG: P-loop NTPase fold protein [Marinifilaceae bacterium]